MHGEPQALCVVAIFAIINHCSCGFLRFELRDCCNDDTHVQCNTLPSSAHSQSRMHADCNAQKLCLLCCHLRDTLHLFEELWHTAF